MPETAAAGLFIFGYNKTNMSLLERIRLGPAVVPQPIPTRLGLTGFRFAGDHRWTLGFRESVSPRGGVRRRISHRNPWREPKT